MSRRISRAALRALRASIAPLAAQARAEREARESVEAEKRAIAKRKLEWERVNAPHPLDEAIRLERLAKQQASEDRRGKRETTSDIYLTSAQISAGKPQPKRE